jgi:hypothetical protein
VANVFFTGAVSYTDNLTNLAVKSPERRITVPASGARYVNFGSLTFPSNTFNGLFGLDIDYFDPVTDEMGSGVVESHRQFTNPAANPTGIDFSVDPPVRLPDRVPATAANDGAFRFGLDFTNSHTIVVPGVWWYWVSGGPSAITPRLFDGSTLVAFGTSVSPSGPDGWRFLPFDSPYLIRAGLTHTVAVSIADGNYKYDASGFIPGGGIISGDGGVTITQGRSESGAGPARPANTADSAAGLALAYTLSDLETLFTTQLPSSTDLNEASPLTIGTTIIFSTAGEIQGVRFFMPLNPSGTYTGAVYVATHNDGASDGSLVASTSFTSQVPGAWNTAWFDEPVLVDATQIYKVVIFSSTGRYVASNHVFTSAAIVNGHLTGVQDAVDAPVGYAPTGVYRNGVYSTSGSLHYPDSTFNENNYFVDPVFLANATEDTGESVRFFAFF